MSSAEKPDANGAERFDADPEAWRKQFWENDGAPGPGDATAKPNGADCDGWGEPDMGVLRLRRRPPPALPLEVFGDTWSRWLTDAAAAAACPVDYVAGPLLASVSTLIGHARWAQAWPGWSEPPHLWMVVVGDSGAGKSLGADCLLRDVVPEWPAIFPIVCANGRLLSNSTRSRKNAGRTTFARLRKTRGRCRCIEKPLFPSLAEDLERQRGRRPPSQPQHAHIGLAPTAVGAVRLSRRIARARGAVIPPELLAPGLGVGVESFSGLGVGFLSARHRWAP